MKLKHTQTPPRQDSHNPCVFVFQLYAVELNIFLYTIYESQSLNQKMENEPQMIDYLNTMIVIFLKCNYIMKESEQLMWVPHSLYSRYKYVVTFFSVTMAYIFNKPRLN